MADKISNFNMLLLDQLRGSMKHEEAVPLLTKLYLLKYVVGLNTIEGLVPTALSRQELELAYRKISDTYPHLEEALVKLDQDKHINEDELVSIIKRILDVPFGSSDIAAAIGQLLTVNKLWVQTPDSLNTLGLELLSPNSNGNFYDGSAGLHGTIITAQRYASAKDIHLTYFTQEKEPIIAALGTIRTFVNGINDIQVVIGDTITDPGFTIDGYSLKTFDSIFMDLPSGPWKYDKKRILYDRYNRFDAGIPSKSNLEWLFILHMLKVLSPGGKAIALVSSSALFAAGTKELRERATRSGILEAVIALPEGLYSANNIPINMMIFNKNNFHGEIMFVNAEELYSTVPRSVSSSGKALEKPHIKKIVEIYRGKKEIEDISKKVPIHELIDSLLLPSRYVAKAEIELEDIGKVKISTEEVARLPQTLMLKDIAQLYRGINTTSATCKPNPNGKYKIINLSDVQDDQLELDHLSRYDIQTNARVHNYLVKSGDILISSKGANIKLCIVSEVSDQVLLSESFIGIRPDGSTLPEFILEYLKSPLGQYLLALNQLGSSVKILNIKDLQEIPIINLQRTEQERIMSEFKKQHDTIRRKIKELEREKRQLKLDLYEKMGIKDTFSLSEG